MNHKPDLDPQKHLWFRLSGWTGEGQQCQCMIHKGCVWAVRRARKKSHYIYENERLAFAISVSFSRNLDWIGNLNEGQPDTARRARKCSIGKLTKDIFIFEFFKQSYIGGPSSMCPDPLMSPIQPGRIDNTQYSRAILLNKVFYIWVF